MSHLLESALIAGSYVLIGLAIGLSSAWLLDASQSEGIAEPLAIVRELHCQEDEDIVTTLGANGLPYAFCQQVIER